MFIYSANRIPEISDDILNIDNAMKWGFGWEAGPFETWDMLGIRKTIDRMKSEGKTVPQWVLDMLESGRETFYQVDNGIKSYWCSIKKSALNLKNNSKVFNISSTRLRNNTIKRDLSASLNDMGDGVLNVEFHSILQPTLHPIDSSYIEMINLAIDMIEKGDYKAMVLGHQGANFMCWS